MDKLFSIRQPITEELALLNKTLTESLHTTSPLMNEVIQAYLESKGKQIRPILVLLCAKLFGEVPREAIDAAASLEMLHNASLIHDDVVDESQKRRGLPTINHLYDNRIAVLVGDYLLSKSVLLSTDNKDFDLLSVIARTIREMSEGELLQLEKARKLDITEDVYYEIIRQKTATLIAACCEVGVLSNNVDETTAKKMQEFGTYTGMAFQIKDDLFDYQTSNIIGKPVGIDIKEQKMTLPLIYTLKNASPENYKKYFATIKRYNNDSKKVRELVEFVKSSGGMDYAITVMKDYQQKALDILAEFPDNDAKKALKLMLDYVIERKL